MIDTDLEDERRELIAKTVLYGPNTPIGHRCFNAIEQRKNIRALQIGYAKSLREIAEHELAAIL